jgi:hypothetical protein
MERPVSRRLPPLSETGSISIWMQAIRSALPHHLVNMKKGIILIALGHPNYGKMAAGLAASIRCMNANIPIVLLTDPTAPRHLQEGERRLFSSIETLHPKYYTAKDGSFSPLQPRVFLDEVTPFECTLSIDVDNLWIQGNDPAAVFDQLEGKYFTIANDGHTITDSTADQKMSQWGDIQEIAQAYKIQSRKFFKVYAEWFYFETNPITAEFFATARTAFMEPPLCRTTRFIGQPITEELAFCIAMARHSLYPHQDKYLPTYWYYRQPDKSHLMPYELKKDYFTYSMGGNATPEWHVNVYNNLAAYVYQKLGLRHPYRWTNKREFIPEREKI